VSTVPRPSLAAHLRLAAHANDVAGTLEHLHRTYGPVADVGYGPVRYTYLIGPEANQHLLADNAANFLWKDAFKLLEVVDGPTALLLSDGDDHRRRRRLVQPAFGIKRVDAHLSMILTQLDQTLDGWRPGARLDAAADLRTAIRRIVVRALFGERLGAAADDIGQRLEPALGYVQRSPLRRLDVDLRWNGYGKAVRATRAVDELILAEVARRRAETTDAAANPDTLSALLVATDEVDGDDDPLTDAELCDQIRSLIAAGYDTTSSSAAWLVHALGSHPEVLSRLRVQVRDTIGDGTPSVEDLRALPLVDGVVREVLRLWPPGAVSGRVAIDDFEVLGHRIPGGSTVLYSPYLTHRLPELWGDPEAFRPGRWADGEPAPYSFVPFGGGGRRCIGFALATLELQALAVRLAQRVTWSLDRPIATPYGLATFAPKGGVPITLG
jgi:cytochrome P450